MKRLIKSKSGRKKQRGCGWSARRAKGLRQWLCCTRIVFLQLQQNLAAKYKNNIHVSPLQPKI